MTSSRSFICSSLGVPSMSISGVVARDIRYSLASQVAKSTLVLVAAAGARRPFSTSPSKMRFARAAASPRGVATVDQANADVDASPSVRSYWRIPYPRAVTEVAPLRALLAVVAAAFSIEAAISSPNASPKCSADIHVPLGYHVSVRVFGRLTPDMSTTPAPAS